MRYALLMLMLMVVAGCTSSFGLGGEKGVGVKTAVGMDGKIVEIVPTDGNGE
jgi:hypothetical protein